MRVVVAAFFFLFLAVPSVLAQQSASYRLEEHVVNLGGRPDDGVTASSAGFRISLDSFGEAAVRAGLVSSSFRVDGSFAGAYPPPGEVPGLRLTDSTTLVWDAEKSVGVYNVYRDALAALSGGGYGTCWRQDLPEATTTDPDVPGSGGGFFYLVTAENRLDEEGTKGSDSGGAPRGGLACP
ncbi:MAG: hypothetical protein Q9Q40_05775 [Acidobacteriota bacterium]|nr:hypothetical protein [Acidobacteriota bacterium]MDQ7087076.1 hypothetical protein [Acidobacteriota bacterium]